MTFGLLSSVWTVDNSENWTQLYDLDFIIRHWWYKPNQSYFLLIVLVHLILLTRLFYNCHSTFDMWFTHYVLRYFGCARKTWFLFVFTFVFPIFGITYITMVNFWIYILKYIQSSLLSLFTFFDLFSFSFLLFFLLVEPDLHDLLLWISAIKLAWWMMEWYNWSNDGFGGEASGMVTLSVTLSSCWRKWHQPLDWWCLLLT